ncbi:TolC family protein [uncultured Planktosalinus sp.]|uniref:TolC family protein n=1 Tax=uncultured Planktosalinus sp. TaxID=1810935 RepID=UPI0030DACB43
MKKTLLVFLSIASSTLLFAQEQKPLSKEQALSGALENNRNLKISEQEFLQARANYRQTNAVFLPNISASHTGFTTTNPLMAFGSKLNQEILTQNDFNPVLLNNPERTDNFATKFEIQQPLINIDGIFQRQAAKSNMQATQLQGQRTQDYILLEVEKAYMQLQLAHKAVNVLEKALEAAQENQKLATNSFKQGYLQRSDVLAVEVRLSEVQNQLQQAKSNVQNASDYLSLLMSEETYTIWKPTDTLEATELASLQNTSLNENRSDIQAMALATDAYAKMNKADQMAFLPRLNAFGSYELYDSELFQGNANGYLVGAQLSWDLFQGGKRFGKAQKSKAELEQSRLELDQYKAQSQMEINKAQRQVNDLLEQLKRSKLAVEQSEEALRIRTNRFEQGLEKTTELLQSETQFAQKQLEYLQTVFEYNFAKAYLEFLIKGE